MHQYLRVPYQVIDQAFIDDPDLTAAEFVIMLILLRHLNRKTGLCCPSEELIAQRTGVNRRTVLRAIQQLVKRKYISIERIPRGKNGGWINNYKILRQM